MSICKFSGELLNYTVFQLFLRCISCSCFRAWSSMSEVISFADELYELLFSIYCVLAACVVLFSLKRKVGGRGGWPFIQSLIGAGCAMKAWIRDMACGVHCCPRNALPSQFIHFRRFRSHARKVLLFRKFFLGLGGCKVS
uniref:Uncharacterized protein n=1 Tax=Parascaris univalens TaxID=6257 RepID=A0A914ZJ64_PARUN